MWQAGPAGCTRIRMVSPSQSEVIDSTAIVFPEVPPFSHRRVARAGVEVGQAGAHRRLQRGLIGPGNHQDIAAAGILHDTRGQLQPLLQARYRELAHSRTGSPAAAASRLTSSIE